jgi:hypothetical protein
VTPAGSECWFEDGLNHRVGGPATVLVAGDPLLHGVIDGPASMWYRRGKLHREDGPAVILADGTEMWWRDGQRHREDGPAIIRVDGEDNILLAQYWLDAEELSEAQWRQRSAERT